MNEPPTALVELPESANRDVAFLSGHPAGRSLLSLPTAGRHAYRVYSVASQDNVLLAIRRIVRQDDRSLSLFDFVRSESYVDNTALARRNRSASARVASQREVLLVIAVDDHTVDIQLLASGVCDDDSLRLAAASGYLIAEVNGARFELHTRRRRGLVFLGRLWRLLQEPRKEERNEQESESQCFFHHLNS